MNDFQRIAVASTFSPRFLPLLAETHQLAAKLERPFAVIHAGERTAENETRFDQAFAQLGFRAPIHWASGSPAEAILSCADENGIDLLIAGALEKKTEGRHFLGHVARVLIRDARCSLMFLTKPSIDPAPFRIIAAITDFSELSRASLRAAIDFSERAEAEKIHVLRVFTVFAQALAEPHQFFSGGQPGQAALAAEEERLQKFVVEIGVSKVPVDARCIEGTTGFAASDFVQSIAADLLVVPAGPANAGQVFPTGLEWLLNVIPSNVLVFRAR